MTRTSYWKCRKKMSDEAEILLREHCSVLVFECWTGHKIERPGEETGFQRQEMLWRDPKEAASCGLTWVVGKQSLNKISQLRPRGGAVPGSSIFASVAKSLRGSPVYIRPDLTWDNGEKEVPIEAKTKPRNGNNNKDNRNIYNIILTLTIGWRIQWIVTKLLSCRLSTSQENYAHL